MIVSGEKASSFLHSTSRSQDAAGLDCNIHGQQICLETQVPLVLTNYGQDFSEEV